MSITRFRFYQPAHHHRGRTHSAGFLLLEGILEVLFGGGMALVSLRHSLPFIFQGKLPEYFLILGFFIVLGVAIAVGGLYCIRDRHELDDYRFVRADHFDFAAAPPQRARPKRASRSGSALSSGSLRLAASRSARSCSSVGSTRSSVRTDSLTRHVSPSYQSGSSAPRSRGASGG